MVVGGFTLKKGKLLRGKYRKFRGGKNWGLRFVLHFKESQKENVAHSVCHFLLGGEENLDGFEKQEKHASGGLI